MDAKTLRAAATGVRFKSGQDMFRMLPGTVVSEHTPPRNATSAQRSAAKAGITGAVSPATRSPRASGRMRSYWMRLRVLRAVLPPMPNAPSPLR